MTGENTATGFHPAGPTPLKVIVVEDEPALCLALTCMLRGAGYSVLPCSCADEALALVGKGTEKIALLVTDILLPGINGHDLARFIQRQLPEIGVVYMSGFSAGHLSDSVLNEPNTVFLQKPFDRARLLQAVAEVSSASGSTNHQ
jgi:DNA-binding NtrC family response regulator